MYNLFSFCKTISWRIVMFFVHARTITVLIFLLTKTFWNFHLSFYAWVIIHVYCQKTMFRHIDGSMYQRLILINI